MRLPWNAAKCFTSWGNISFKTGAVECWRGSVVSWLGTLQSRIKKLIIFICFCTRGSHCGHPLLLTSLPELYGLHKVELANDFWRTREASLQPRQEPSTPKSSSEAHQHILRVWCAQWWTVQLDIAFAHNLLYDMAFWCYLCSTWSVACSNTKLAAIQHRLTLTNVWQISCNTKFIFNLF
jgi:hypothetical protein